MKSKNYKYYNLDKYKNCYLLQQKKNKTDKKWAVSI